MSNLWNLNPNFTKNQVLRSRLGFCIRKYYSMPLLWVPRRFHSSFCAKMRGSWKSRFFSRFCFKILGICLIFLFFWWNFIFPEFSCYVTYDNGEVLKMTGELCTLKSFQAQSVDMYRYLGKIGNMRLETMEIPNVLHWRKMTPKSAPPEYNPDNFCRIGFSIVFCISECLGMLRYGVLVNLHCLSSSRIMITSHKVEKISSGKDNLC